MTHSAMFKHREHHLFNQTLAVLWANRQGHLRLAAYVARNALFPIKSALLHKFVDFHPEVTRAFHRELTRLKVMFYGLCLGQDMQGLPFGFGYC